MTHKDDFEKLFPQDKGPQHYRQYKIQPYEFISKNNLSFFQGCVIKYACRYMQKDKVKDLEKKKMKDTK
jgi:hypothetical protein